MEFLLYFFFVLVILGLLFRYLIPILLRWFIKRTIKKMANQQPLNKDEETKITGQEPVTKAPKEMGEYVDFEIIEENK